jgi:hypothetical protein
MSTAYSFRSLDVHHFVKEKVEEALLPGGFSFDVARGLWTRSVAAGIEHFITLPADIADLHGPLAVTANLGVHCRLLANKLSVDYDLRRANNLATFTRNVGQLSARRSWRDWVIRDVDEAARVATRLSSRLISIGLPWLAKFNSLIAVAEGFRMYGREDHRQLALPMLDAMNASGMHGDGLVDDDGSAEDEEATADRLRMRAILPLRGESPEAVQYSDN